MRAEAKARKEAVEKEIEGLYRHIEDLGLWDCSGQADDRGLVDAARGQRKTFVPLTLTYARIQLMVY